MVAKVARGRASWLFPSLTLAAVVGITPAFAADPVTREYEAAPY
jgi:hypothetical protein